jgi:uncharacterized protein (DUF849 family)
MTRGLDDIIVTCALTGAIHTPTMSDHLPVTPDEIVSEGIAAAEAGASIIHVHVRDPETGEPVSDVDLFREVVGGIQAETDAIVQPTTGGGMNQTVEERMQTIPAIEPEMASCNMGSMNFGLYPMAEAIEEFEYEWEADYLDGTWDHVFPNTFESLKTALELFDEHDTVPELECYDVGMLHNAKHFYDRGLLEPPIHLQFVMGILGGIGADAENLTYLVNVAEKLFGDQFSFSVIGAGRNEFSLGSQAVSMDGHVRVGLEDNLYLRKGELATSNAELVEKMASLTDDLTGRQVASPADVRSFLELKGRDDVAL